MMVSNTLKLNQWQRRLFIQILLIFIVITSSVSMHLKTDSNETCFSSECIQTASRILNNMDLNVNPCDNFYKFTCGNFINTTIIPNDKIKVDLFSTLTDQVQEQLRIIVETDISSNMSKPLRLVKTFYNICRNETAIEKQGLSPLRSKLRKLGGWPVLERENWTESKFNWTNTVYMLKNMGYSVKYLLGVEIAPDIQNNTNNVINIKMPKLGILSEFFLRGPKDKVVENYKKYMLDVAILLGADRDYADKELTESLLFESKLANTSAVVYNPMTIADLEKTYPSIPWLEYFSKLLEPNVKVDKNETVIAFFPQLLTDFENLMNTTSKRIQANYLIWRVIADSIPYLNNEIYKKKLDFLASTSGRTKRQSRSIECLNAILKYMPLNLGALYVKKFFNHNAKNNVIEIVNDIKSQFRKTLESVNWMDEETRTRALDKADAMMMVIAYNDGLLNETILEEIYKNFEINESDSYLQTVLNMELHMEEINQKDFRKPVTKSDWKLYVNPMAVNAFHYFFYNIIQIPAAILQGSIFHQDRPRYMNYGALGYLVGHEITHGFDTFGKKFDKDGNFIDWWEPLTDAEFWKKAVCFHEQYNKYTVDEVGMNVNGLKTITENVADNGGMKTTYLAYKNWADSHKPEPRLPGLERYTPNQMFWISAAQTWCTVLRPEALKTQMISDTHSPAEFRVLGTFSNIEEFSKDFECSPGIPMNPKNKCTVW